jgi:hypothetical protein
MKRILDDKERRRRELAALPYPEKVRIVEQLRAVAASIRASASKSRQNTPSPES